MIASLRVDLSDPVGAGALFTDRVLDRCLRKGLHVLGMDLRLKWTVTLAVDPDTDDTVTPPLLDDQVELVTLLGHIHACEIMQANTALGFSFTSGDKRVDKTKQPAHWAALADSLRLEYRQLLSIKQLGFDSEGYVIVPVGGGLVFEPGINPIFPGEKGERGS